MATVLDCSVGLGGFHDGGSSARERRWTRERDPLNQLMHYPATDRCQVKIRRFISTITKDLMNERCEGFLASKPIRATSRFPLKIIKCTQRF